MNPKKIIIATITLLFLSSFLTGCDFIQKGGRASLIDAEDKQKNEEILQLFEKAAAVEKDVTISLTGRREGAQVIVTINLENPNQKPITSVQSWLSFDALKLQGNEIDTTNSSFSLVAPYANEFDNQNGLVMIGRSNTTAVTDRTLTVAEVTFDSVQDGTTTLDFYDYRDDLTGHTSANTVFDGMAYNILIQPDSPAFVIETPPRSRPRIPTNP